MISQKARYALKALTALARLRPGESLQIRLIAEAENIPQAFLEHIMLDLKQARLVGSRRGKAGGYRLVKAPETIFVMDIVNQIDGPLLPWPCLSGSGGRCPDCRSGGACALRAAFDNVVKAMRAAMAGLSLAEMVRRAQGPDTGDPAYGQHPFSGAFI